MSTTIQIKRSSTASAVPLSGDLAVGELAVNLADKRLFAKQADGTIIELSTNPTDLDAATLRIDGVEITASATELNSLDGLTATTAELNILDGVTATTTELNYTDGVTSNIQTQLDSMVEKAGDTMTGDLSLGDGVKAKFGASDDLQIYHDGNDSYIDEVGTGNLLINADNIRLRDTTGNPYMLGNSGAEVRIYHNGATKLQTTATGVGVTGNMESDSVTIGVGSVATTEKLRVNGTVLTLGGSVSTPAIGIGDVNTGIYAPTSGTLGWAVNGTQKLLLNSTGVDVTGTITADGLTVDGDINVSGGVYLGGTGAANKLDDYETGTWTPTVITSGGGSYALNIAYGSYVKTGKIVTVTFNVRRNGTALSGTGGDIFLSGLPFTCSGANEARYSGCVRYQNVSTTPIGTIVCYAQPASSILLFTYATSDGYTTSAITDSDINGVSSGYIQGSITYEATA